MSIAGRVAQLMRANLGALADRVETWAPRRGAGARLDELSDEELEAELQRRRRQREGDSRSGERAGHNPEDAEQAAGGSARYRSAGGRSSSRSGGGKGNARHSSGGRPSPAQRRRRAQLYAKLECPDGADLTTVRKHYRQLMRKYHPDMHSQSADKQRVATELTQKLTAAYNELRRILR